MQVTEFDDRKETFSQLRFLQQTLWESAKRKLVRTDPEDHRRAVVVPLTGPAAQVHPAAVGDKAGFYFRIGRA